MELEIVPQLKGNNYKVTLLDMLNTPSMHHVESHLYLVTLAVSSPSKSWRLETECARMVGVSMLKGCCSGLVMLTRLLQ